MARRNGMFEYGTIYEIIDQATNQLGDPIGRLVVDPDNNTFWQQTPGLPAKRLSEDTVKTLVARDAIVFDHNDGRSRLINFLIQQEERERAIRNRELLDKRNKQKTEALNTETKLYKKTKRNSRIAKLTWTAGCFVMIGMSVFMSIPSPEPAPAIASIAGEGTDYGVDQSLLTDATYISVMGNGSTVYGVVMDNEIVESGQNNSNESTVKENVMVTPSVSSVYPLHMRPLYYDRSTYHQSMIKLNDTNGGSSGIYLQNPNGYITGVPANELVLVGGQGLATVVLSSPTNEDGDDADEAARNIEERQREAEIGNTQNNQQDEDTFSSDMPDGWAGYDYADIDGNMIAASYYYTRNNTGRAEDLHRRVVIHNISSVYNEGSSGVSDITSIQMNYQDLDGNYYDPVISNSPSSNGSVNWVGYMYSKADGSEASFNIRRYETAEDILLQSDTNNYTTNDITGNDYPITNYTLSGDLLFYEQQGAIWVSDLSKISISINGTDRVVSRTNPVKICSSSDIKSSVSSDDAFIASALHQTQVPTADYQIMSITTVNGVEYGIAYIESQSGNLVFRPCNNITVAASNDSGNDQNQNTENANENGTQDQNTSQQNTNTNEQTDTNQSNDQSTQQQNSSTDANNSNTTGEQPAEQQTQQESASNQEPTTIPTAYTKNIESTNATTRTVADENTESNDDGSNDAILIRPSSDNVSIICFTVRGEQVYWIEENTESGERSLKLSPVYYRNDAQQAIENGETQEESPAISATDQAPDTNANKEVQQQAQADEQRRREEQARVDSEANTEANNQVEQPPEQSNEQSNEQPQQETEQPQNDQQPAPQDDANQQPTTFTDAE